jgi:hypothetical protein
MTTQRGASKTLKAGEHRLAFTIGVEVQMALDPIEFTQFVDESLLRFNRGDWGNVGAEDWKANDADLEALNSGHRALLRGERPRVGSWNGRILASYVTEQVSSTTSHNPGKTTTIWIIRNTAEKDGTQAIMVLFPDEY